VGVRRPSCRDIVLPLQGVHLYICVYVLRERERDLYVFAKQWRDIGACFSGLFFFY
jgi:hypothetical protein